MHTLHGIHHMDTMLHTCRMYARVYTCTHCDRKCHFVKFCYDRLDSLNFACKNVWARNGNKPHGPKNVWVPKIIPLAFDVGVGSHKM